MMGSQANTNMMGTPMQSVPGSNHAMMQQSLQLQHSNPNQQQQQQQQQQPQMSVQQQQQQQGQMAQPPHMTSQVNLIFVIS